MAERKMARNALKGYTFQNYIFTLFLAIMDAERKIVRIESESLHTKHFDALCVVMEDGTQPIDKNIQTISRLLMEHWC